MMYLMTVILCAGRHQQLAKEHSYAIIQYMRIIQSAIMPHHTVAGQSVQQRGSAVRFSSEVPAVQELVSTDRACIHHHSITACTEGRLMHMVVYYCMY